MPGRKKSHEGDQPEKRDVVPADVKQRALQK